MSYCSAIWQTTFMSPSNKLKISYD